ncbi:MAG: C39 family peptidase [Lachnospiraceae bacterium]|nr:C39 family peptidase [Lachnospiraceae bacterium]
MNNTYTPYNNVRTNQYSNYSYSNYNSQNDTYYNAKQEYKRKLKRKRRIKHNLKIVCFLFIFSTIIFFLAGRVLKNILSKLSDEEQSTLTMSYDIGVLSGNDLSYESTNKESLYTNSTENYDNVDTDEIPSQLIDFMEHRPETTDFVMSYPKKHDVDYYIDLSNEITSGEIPLLIQWDERWGYKQYGDDFFALNGCAPTCLSMVCLGLGGNTGYDPYTVGTIFDENGYYEIGTGTKWSAMTEGAGLIGLNGEEISLDEYVIRNKLNSGSPIICSMRPGDFTQTGHFIVLTGIDSYDNVYVNDPCSIENSNKTWELNQLIPQIKNLWSFTLS